MDRVRTGVIGVGYLGQFHAEKYAALPDVELVGIVDTDPVRGGQIAQKLGTHWYPNADALLDCVDAVSIVVPTAFHYQVARPFLERGVNVLLEKPVTVTLEQADELIAAADRNRVVFQVGHIERFNPVVHAISTRISSPVYLTAERAAPFTVRCTDVNVVLDLMIHDLDIVSRLAGSEPKEISAAGASIITDEIDLAAARITFQNGCVADVTASRISDDKRRLLRVFEGRKVYSADFQTQKAWVAQRNGEAVPGLAADEIPTERRDTLQEEIKAFIASIRSQKAPLVTGREGRRALALARLITDIISRGVTGFVPVV